MKKNRVFTRLLVALLAIVMSMSCISMPAFAAGVGRTDEKETIKVRFLYFQDNYVEEEMEVPKGATSVSLKDLQELAKEAGIRRSGWEWHIRDEYTLQIKTDQTKNVKYVSARIEFGDAQRKIHVQYQKTATNTTLPQTNDILVDYVTPFKKNDEDGKWVEAIDKYWVEGLVEDLYGWELANDGPYEIIKDETKGDMIIVPVKAPRETIYVDFKIDINAGGTFVSEKEAERRTIDYTKKSRIITLPAVKPDTYHTFDNKWQVVGEGLTVTGPEVNLALIPGWPEGSATRLITLSPIFNARAFTVNFVNGNESRGTMEAKTVTMQPDDIVTPPAVTPKKDYVFGYWCVAGKTKADDIKVDRFDYDTLFKLQKNGNVTLTARFETLPYTVKFNVGNGSWQGPSEYTLHEDEVYTIPSVIPPKGQTFKGWYIGDKKVFTNNGKLTYEFAEQAGKDHVLTLTAKYGAAVTVRFNMLNGTWSGNEAPIEILLDGEHVKTWQIPTITAPEGLYFWQWKIKGTSKTYIQNDWLSFDALKHYGSVTLEPVWWTGKVDKDGKLIFNYTGVVDKDNIPVVPNANPNVLFVPGDGYAVVGKDWFEISEGDTDPITAPSVKKVQSSSITKEDSTPLMVFKGWAFEADGIEWKYEAGDQIEVKELLDYIKEKRRHIIFLPVYGEEGDEENAETVSQSMTPATASAPFIIANDALDAQKKLPSNVDDAQHLDGETGDALYGSWFDLPAGE